MTWGSDLSVSLRGVVGEFFESFGFCEKCGAGEKSAEFVLARSLVRSRIGRSSIGNVIFTYRLYERFCIGGCCRRERGSESSQAKQQFEELHSGESIEQYNKSPDALMNFRNLGPTYKPNNLGPPCSYQFCLNVLMQQ